MKIHSLIILAACQIPFIRMSYLRATKNNNLDCNLAEIKLVMLGNIVK